MLEKKNTNTASRPANTAMKLNIHTMSWYRRILHNRIRLFLFLGVVVIILVITIITFIFRLSSNFSDISGIFMGTILSAAGFFTAILQAFPKIQQMLFPQQPVKPLDPPSVYAIRHTLSSTSSIITAAWSPDGQKLACADIDTAIYLWDVETGTLLYTFPGRQSLIWSVVWSPKGKDLAASSINGNIDLLDSETGKVRHTLSGHRDLAWSVVWSPDGQRLATGSVDHTVCLWDTETGKLLHTLTQHTKPVITVAWSPDGQKLTSGSLDQTICLWNVEEGSCLSIITGHRSPIRSLFWSLDGQSFTSLSEDDILYQWNIEGKALTAWNMETSNRASVWASDGRTFAVGFSDHSINLIDITKDSIISRLEGHVNSASYLAFSSDSQSLASFAFSDTRRSRGTILIWCRIGVSWVKATEMLNIPVGLFITFHPELKAFATLDQSSKDIVTWERDDTVADDSPLDDAFYYRNAKVVLVGDSGVGKSGLGMVLIEKQFEATESNHARHIWTLYEKKYYRDDQYTEVREILLWDLAGQPGYRLIHQLHLDEVTLALVVFDSKSETDPFAGVFHWARALAQAQCIQGRPAFPLKKFLVAARVDRGGSTVSDKRIEELKQRFKFDRYFQTSAKTGREIAELKKAIVETIVWEELPGISSTQLFQKIKSFLVAEKKAGLSLETVDALYRMFLIAKALEQRDGLRAQFETCIGHVESAGLIKRLSFGNLVLLQPELLDTYASALINAVRDEPEGFGSIEEEKVRRGDFFIPEEERLKDKQHEHMLLIAMVEDLLYRELILRERDILVFPAQSTRDDPDLPEPEKKAVAFTFDGPILNIYATLAVRLANSGMFKRDGLWKNAVTYDASIGGRCGLCLETNNEGHGALSLFFDEAANEQTRYQFEEYVQLHLQRKALPDSLKRKRIFICVICGMVVTEQMLQLAEERSLAELDCSICKTKISLLDREQRIPTLRTSLAQEMDYTADRQRERETRKSKQDGTRSILAAKRERNEFDVFLCCNDEDKPAVRQYGEELKDFGILPWFEEWEVPPGVPWQRELEKQIKQVKSAAIFIGKINVEKWERLIEEALLREFVRRKCPVVPVLLPEAIETPNLPLFLEGMRWVDFRQEEPDPLQQLVWGITGEKPDQPE